MKPLATILSMLALLSFVDPASAQNCYPMGCQVGPCTAENILADSYFSAAYAGTCPTWVISGAAQFRTDFGGNYWVEFNNSYGVVEQTQRANTLGSTFDLIYKVQFENTRPTYWQELDVFIYDADTGQRLAWVDSLTGYAGNFSWQYRELSLGYHPEWRDKNLKVLIEGYAYYGAVFKVTDVSLWQNYW